MAATQTTLEGLSTTLACLPYGTGRDQEGLCLLVRMGPYRLLLDCGRLPPLTAEQPPADWAICSHAHADHAHGFLGLHRRYPQLPIYTSEPTGTLLTLNWPEEAVEPFWETLAWRSPLQLAPDLQVQLFPAGHLPGAAAVLLAYQTPERPYTLLYTGDFFLSNSRLVEGLSLESLRNLAPDVLIVGGRYGTARHPRRRQLEKQFLAQIEEALMRDYSVLLPVPPLGLGQEILMLLRSHHQFTGRDLDIWVAGQVASACDRYLELLPQLPAAVQNFARHQPLFWDDRVLPRVQRFQPDRSLGPTRFPCLLLTDDERAWQACRDRSRWLLLQPEGLDPATEFPGWSEELAALPQESYLLPDHSDGRNTTQLIHNIRPQHAVFIRGQAADLADLTSLEELQSRYQLHSPAAGTVVELPVGDRFLQPETPPARPLEGEIEETEHGLSITLPPSLAASPRWAHFADTGLVEARWQGEELVLRGLSQRELLRQTQAPPLRADGDCCRQCRYQQGQRCGNPRSPLYGFKVLPEGYCPAFAARS